jgi:hypothetical protein
MDSWVVGQIAFWYTVYEISPTTVVDKLITFWLDLTIPGRGTGGSNWCVDQSVLSFFEYLISLILIR